MATRTAKAETPTEEKPEETPEAPKEETPEAPKAEGLTSEVKQYVKELFDEVVETLSPKGKGEGRRSYRDEEDEMNELVGSKVKELFDKEKAAGEKHPDPTEDKAKPEPVPAQKPGRRVERVMGW